MGHKKNDTLKEKTTKTHEEMQDDTIVEENEKNETTDSKEASSNDALRKEIENLSQEELVEKYLNLAEANEVLEKESQEAKNAANDYLDKYKRSLAEMENLRKRTIQDKQDSLKYGSIKLIEDLLIILDDFQRAIDSVKAGTEMNIESFAEGIEMIEKQFVDLLFKKYSVSKFGEEGEPFDPNKHQAMMMEEGDYKEEVVLSVFRKGYQLHERIIRPAQVKVGKPA